MRGEADIVIGSRVLGGADPGALTPVQRFGNALACTLIALGWGRRFEDLGPFRALRLPREQGTRMVSSGAAPLRWHEPEENVETHQATIQGLPRSFPWSIQTRLRSPDSAPIPSGTPPDSASRARDAQLTGEISTASEAKVRAEREWRSRSAD